MKVELLFLRWLFVIAVAAIGIIYVRSVRQERPVARYETIPLIQGGRSSGMPLAGIIVDPKRRDVYAIVGGPKPSAETPQFCILWKGKEGETYGATFPAESVGAQALFAVSPDGQIRPMQELKAAGADQTDVRKEHLASSETTLRTIIEALPATPSVP